MDADLASTASVPLARASALIVIDPSFVSAALALSSPKARCLIAKCAVASHSPHPTGACYAGARQSSEVHFTVISSRLMRRCHIACSKRSVEERTGISDISARRACNRQKLTSPVIKIDGGKIAKSEPAIAL